MVDGIPNRRLYFYQKDIIGNSPGPGRRWCALEALRGQAEGARGAAQEPRGAPEGPGGARALGSAVGGGWQGPQGPKVIPGRCKELGEIS